MRYNTTELFLFFYCTHCRTGAEPDIFIWGATGVASFATRGAVNGLCRTSMQWHDVTRKILGGTGGTRQNFWGEV